MKTFFKKVKCVYSRGSGLLDLENNKTIIYTL